ncbi:MAG: BrxA/BrxB family bacilliredoxin [Gemmatimonadales bacterium]|nr:BrxA/BrxB family bacilliredoxin [Gemmatimonadales bacterium]MDZ4259468.1 BrxA/BrxB family bacilliredoxin [Gemmatimonadales bacterium]
MPYPELMIKPMREEVTRLGVQELKTVDDVDSALASADGTAFVFVNSMCGCAAGGARPALAKALASTGKKPARLYTVFAGQELEATARVRSYLGEYQPSSPSAALLKDGEVVAFIHRHQIEGRSPDQIASAMVAAFEEHC